MAFGFDPSIILSATKTEQPTPNQTLQTLAQLASQRTQQQHADLQIADLLRQQQREQTLADIYRGNAGTPDNLATALMRGGFGKEASEAQDQAVLRSYRSAEADQRLEAVKAAHRKEVGEMFADVTDQAGLDAVNQRLAAHPDPLIAYYAPSIPQKYEGNEAAIKRLGNLAIPAEKRAMIAAMGGKGPTITGEDGTQYRLNGTTATAVTDESGKTIKARPRAAGGGGAGAGAGGGLTQEALEQQVDAYHSTGKLDLPARGKSAEVMRLQILNRHAEKYPTGDIAMSKADYKANTETLQALQKQSAFVDQFEGTAEKNLDLFVDRATKKLVDTGSPLLNTPVREFETKLKGDPELAAINALRQTAISEVSKVLSGNPGSGGATEGVRHEAAELMRSDATVGQIIETAKALKQDMANRKASVAKSIEDVRTRISGKPAAAEGGSSKAVDHYLVSPDKKERVPVYADGTRGKREPNP